MPFWVKTDSSLRLAIAPRPRGGDWLEDDIRALQRDGVDILFSLLTPEESRELGLVGEEPACRAVGIRFLNYPIPDRRTPDSTHDFVAFVRSLYGDANAGRANAVHCRACIGRSSVLLASLMRLDGLKVEDAFDRISSARGLSVPDTPEQAAWVGRLIF